MEIIATSTDIIYLARIRAVLEDEGVPVFELDGYIAGAEGSIGAFPRRLAVPSGAWPKVRAILINEGLWNEGD